MGTTTSVHINQMLCACWSLVRLVISGYVQKNHSLDCHRCLTSRWVRATPCREQMASGRSVWESKPIIVIRVHVAFIAVPSCQKRVDQKCHTSSDICIWQIFFLPHSDHRLALQIEAHWPDTFHNRLPSGQDWPVQLDLTRAWRPLALSRSCPWSDHSVEVKWPCCGQELPVCPQIFNHRLRPLGLIKAPWWLSIGGRRNFYQRFKLLAVGSSVHIPWSTNFIAWENRWM